MRTIVQSILYGDRCRTCTVSYIYLTHSFHSFVVLYTVSTCHKTVTSMQLNKKESSEKSGKTLFGSIKTMKIDKRFTNVFPGNNPHIITKTCLFKYIENVTTKNLKVFQRKILIFFIFVLKT